MSFAPPTEPKVTGTLLPMFYRGVWACWVYPSNRGKANSVQFIAKHPDGNRGVNVEIFINQVPEFDPDAFYNSRTGAI